MRSEKSGAQKRKEKAEREAAQASEREQMARERRQSAYGDLAPPPDSPVGVMAWAHQLAARMLYDVMLDESIGEQERRRYASDLIAKIGLTAPKAHSDARLKQLEKKAGLDKEPDPDGDAFDERPPRASGAGAIGSDALPAPAPVADPEGDGRNDP